MPSLGTLKLIGYGLAALAVIALFAMVMGWKSERDHLRSQVAATCAITRSAADNPKMSCKNVDEQIKLLGQAVADLKAGIARQSAAVNALAAESDRQKAAASAAVQKAKGRAQAAQATSERLNASSRAGGLPCEPSKALKDAWQ